MLFRVHINCGFILDVLLNLILWHYVLLGLSFGTDDQSLKDAFSGFGEVVDGENNSHFPVRNVNILNYMFSQFCFYLKNMISTQDIYAQVQLFYLLLGICGGIELFGFAANFQICHHLVSIQRSGQSQDLSGFNTSSFCCH